ncbi:hypothetical protein ACAG26_23760 [Mycobacterium sp. pUA109]|uniref:hypothetical protein n=1 Tax=Mycobacterium sp. pUA109 TaxID=3238982 RepID=UPI00351B282A
MSVANGVGLPDAVTASGHDPDISPACAGLARARRNQGYPVRSWTRHRTWRP